MSSTVALTVSVVTMDKYFATVVQQYIDLAFFGRFFVGFSRTKTDFVCFVGKKKRNNSDLFCFCSVLPCPLRQYVQPTYMYGKPVCMDQTQPTETVQHAAEQHAPVYSKRF